MKKNVLIAAICLVTTFIANAQIEKGKVFLGGNLSLNHARQNNRNSSYTTLEFSPNVGYFIGRNIAIGSTLGYSRSRSFFEDGNAPRQVTTNNFYISPFFRITKGNEFIHFFAQLSGAFGWMNPEDITTYKSNFFSAGFSPGIIIFPTKSLGIELALQGLSFRHNRQKNTNFDGTESLSVSNSYNLGINFSAPSLGVQYYF